jgi:hypothetical protein
MESNHHKNGTNDLRIRWAMAIFIDGKPADNWWQAAFFNSTKKTSVAHLEVRMKSRCTRMGD